MTNIIQGASYGNEKQQILQSFVKTNNKEFITERRFDPFIYQPLNSNFISNVEMEIKDESGYPFKIIDSHTNVKLYFQKVN